MTAAAQQSSVVRQLARRSYHAARNLPDRLLHRRRHEAVRQQLSSRRRPRTILVVCYGNVCRSPYLEAVLQRALPDVTVSSAGFVGSDRKVPAISMALSADRGLDLSHFRSRPLMPDSVNSADLIVVMDSDQAREITRRFAIRRSTIVIAGDLDPSFTGSRAIIDPWNKSRDVFIASFDRLDRCAAVLVNIFQSAN
jgi:protein-tyrosine phosphatase